MTRPTFSVVLATGGRNHLGITAAITAAQLEHGDELLVERLDCAWGGEARNRAMPRCAGTHLLFIDDDDVHAAGALQLIRDRVAVAPDRVHFFAMRYLGDGRVLEPAWPLQIGRISTQMFVVPNVPDLLGRWSSRYEQDFDFIHSTMQLRGDEPVLHPDVVIAEIGTPTLALHAVGGPA